jgi:TPR repeat protein
MHKKDLIKLHFSIIYKFIKYTVLNVLLMLVVSSYHTCVSNLTSQKENILNMYVTSNMDKQIEAEFNIAEGTDIVRLADYRIRVEVHPIDTRYTSSSLIYYAPLEGQQLATNIERMLSEFSDKGVLVAKEKPLIVPFKLLPGKGVTSLIVSFELLDNYGQAISVSKVRWYDTFNEPNGSLELLSAEGLSTCLRFPSKEKIKNNLIEDVSSQNAIQPEVSDMAIERVTCTTRGQKRILETNKKEVDLSDVFVVAEKNVKRLAKNKVTDKRAANDNDQQEISTPAVSITSHIFESDAQIGMDYKELARQTLELEFEIACMLETGIGPAGNMMQAFMGFEKIAKQGHLEAQFKVAYMLENGLGTRRNFKQALKWYKTSAEQGHIEAWYRVAYMLENGIGAKKNFEEAFGWFEGAAEQGHMEAKFRAARMLEKGIGIEKDVKQAFEWYKLAARQGHIGAQLQVAYMLEHGVACVKDLCDAFTWYQAAAKQGHLDAQFHVARILENQTRITKDNNKAFK